MRVLASSFVRQCKRRRFRSKVADSTGEDLTGGALLTRALILRRLLARSLDPEETFVGLLLPPSAGAVVVNAAMALSRRVAVNLNYSASSEIVDACIRQAGIRHVLTSRRVMERLDLTIDAEIVYLEDLRSAVTPVDKVVGALQAYLVPAPLLERGLGLDRIEPADLLTVIFTSGSTGIPKGVMLTQANIAANIDAIDRVIRLKPTDAVVGILPFFHSFGYTGTLWAVLALDIKGAYHFNPLEPRPIGALCRQHRGTILMAAPTFLRVYQERCDPADLASLEVVATGAEALPADLAHRFEGKFGVRPVEGYGATELSPLVSVNVPPSRSPEQPPQGYKEGTVGRPVHEVSVKVVSVDTGDALGTDEPGLLLVRGPNVMQGYLDQPELTAEVLRDGWYDTGDVGSIDRDGFITITDRLSRISKIGGEMVPHVGVEEKLNAIIGGGDSSEAPAAAVTAVRDPQKGERLIVLHTPMDETPEAITSALVAAGLPRLWIPSAGSFLEVPVLPMLGSGKLDLAAINRIARERLGAQE